MSRQRFSALALIRRGLSGHRGWQPQWRKASPQPAYDAVIVGGGGHGLGAAYYLAKEHNLGRVAVLEKGWIGSGNAGLFDPEDGTTATTSGFPQLSNRLYFEALEPFLALATRAALNRANSQQEWNTFLLSSPDFNYE